MLYTTLGCSPSPTWRGGLYGADNMIKTGLRGLDCEEGINNKSSKSRLGLGKRESGSGRGGPSPFRRLLVAEEAQISRSSLTFSVAHFPRRRGVRSRVPKKDSRRNSPPRTKFNHEIMPSLEAGKHEHSRQIAPSVKKAKLDHSSQTRQPLRPRTYVPYRVSKPTPKASAFGNLSLDRR